MVLNVKKLRLKSYAPHPVQLRLLKSGAGVVTGNDIEQNPDVEIVNPDQQLLTLDSDDVTVEIDMTVERGVGYLAAERSEQLPIGVIPVDAIFSPVRKVNYTVENTRVGQMTNFDKLDHRDRDRRHAYARRGTQPRCRDPGRPVQPVHDRRQADGRGRPRRHRRAPVCRRTCSTCRIEELDLPMRAYNSLKRNNIVKVGQLLQLQDEDLLRMRNFGKKSLDEMKERLQMRGFLPPDDGSRGDRLRRRGRPRHPGRRRGRGVAVGGSPHRRPQAQPQDRPAHVAVREPDRVRAALRADQDDRGARQGESAARSRRSSRWPRKARWRRAGESSPSCPTSRSSSTS